MARRDLKLIATSQEGKKITTTLAHANPTATGETLITFAQRLNALTTNTYDETDLVTTTVLDTEDPPIEKTEPTLTITKVGEGGYDISHVWLQELLGGCPPRFRKITYNGDGQLYAYTDMPNLAVGINTTKEGYPYVVANFGWYDNSEKPASFPTGKKVYVGATEGENYSAKIVSFDIE